MSMIRKVFTSEIKSIDEEKRTLVAYVSTSARDRHNESVDHAGIDLSKFKKNPVVLWAHNYDELPIAKAQWIKRDGEGILSKMEFATHPKAQEVFELYKGGFMRAFSIGFMPDAKSVEDGDGDKQPRRTYRKSELLEYSAVPVPANPEALALALKSGVLKTGEIKESLESYVDPDDKCWDIKEQSIPKEGTGAGKVLLQETPASWSLDELQAENKQLNDKVAELEKENGELRLKLFNELTIKHTKPPEITVEILEAKTLEILSGVIRKAQGKVD